MSKRTAPIDTEHTQYTQHQAKKQHIQPSEEIPNPIKRNREDDNGYESDITMNHPEEYRSVQESAVKWTARNVNVTSVNRGPVWYRYWSN